MTTDENKLLDKIKNNEDLKISLTSYYKAFKQASEQNHFSLEYGGSKGSSGWLSYTRGFREHEHRASSRITKLLGSKYGDETEVKNLFQSKAHDCLIKSGNSDVFIQSVFDAAIDILKSDIEIYFPNYLVNPVDKNLCIQIGNVRIISSTKLNKEVTNHVDSFSNKPVINIQFDEITGLLSYNFSDQNEFPVPSSPIMWGAKVRACPSHAREEALWQINVAISLIRLLSNKWSGKVPKLYDVEPHPVALENGGMTIGELRRTKSSYSFGSMKTLPHYFISQEVNRDLIKPANKKIFTNVFTHNNKTVGEQVYYALGWLSKGRQTDDRSERLLYFFTAIEAILAREDKNSPIVDTIARHGSVIISRTIKTRSQVAKQFKELYQYRSLTVHRGQRSSSWNAANKAHHFAELLTLQVIKKCDLSQMHQNFCEDLAEASYGKKWP